MKCLVCNDYEFEHRLDLEKHSLSMHGVSSEKRSRESSSAKTQSAQLMKVAAKAASREHQKDPAIVKSFGLGKIESCH
jgi:hypothetical protein